MFIYVMTEEDRDKLISLGFTLVKSTSKIWAFENKNAQCFDNLDVPCVISDILTF